MSSSFVLQETHDVKIADIKPFEQLINVIFQVVSKGEEREINKRSGETHRVCDFVVADPTASITLTLWEDDIDIIKEGNVYKIENGCANVYRNSLRLAKGEVGILIEDETVFDEVDQEVDRSSEYVEDNRRRNRSFGSQRRRGSFSHG